MNRKNKENAEPNADVIKKALDARKERYENGSYKIINIGATDENNS